MDAADAESAEAIKVENIGRIDFLQLRSVEILCWPSFLSFFGFYRNFLVRRRLGRQKGGA